MKFQKAAVTIRGPFRRTKTVKGLRHGDWAVIQLPGRADLWVLVLLPLGFYLPLEWSSFTSARRACAAMMEIQRIRNSWSVITQADLTIPLRDQLMAICRRYGAVEGPVTMSWDIDKPAFGHEKQDGRLARVNGYALP